MNKYDLNHRVAHHGKMSDAEWEEAYRAAWAAYYTPDHIRTILRRSAACKLGRPGTTLSTILWFYLMILFEGVHPLEGGALRLKFRRDRRHGMPRESAFVFYPRYGVETLRQDVALLVGLPAAARRSSTRCWRRPIAGPTPTSRSRRRRPTNTRRSTSITPPPAARPRSPASIATTRSATGSQCAEAGRRLRSPRRRAPAERRRVDSIAPRWCDPLRRRRTAHSPAGDPAMSQPLVARKPFDAPIVDQLAVRVVVDSRYERFLPKMTHAVHGHRECRPGAGPADDVAGVRVGIVAAPRIDAGRPEGAVHAGFRLHARDRAAQRRPARHRPVEDRRPDPQPRAPRPFRRHDRLHHAAPQADAAATCVSTTAARKASARSFSAIRRSRSRGARSIAPC